MTQTPDEARARASASREEADAQLAKARAQIEPTSARARLSARFTRENSLGRLFAEALGLRE